MLPTFTLGGWVVHSYTAAMVVAALAAVWLARGQARHIGLDPRITWDMLPFALVGGLAGARLLHVSVEPAVYLAEPWLLLSPRGGQVWYGGLLGGVALCLWRLRIWQLAPVRALGGAAAPVALAHAIGRVGCFLQGDDWGRPTDLPWGVAFPEGSPPTTAAVLRDAGVALDPALPGDAVLAVHPTQLYESAFLLVLCAVTWGMWRRDVQPARIVATYLGGYGAWRFVIEFVRVKSDHLPVGITVSQAISLGFLLAAVLLWRRRAVVPESPPQSSAHFAGESA